MELLNEYAQAVQEMNALKARVADIESKLKEHVGANGPVQAYGYAAKFKAGRKSTDHEAAATAANVAPELIEKHSTVKITVAWAQVTKAAKIDTTSYTTEGAPSFVVEAVK